MLYKMYFNFFEKETLNRKQRNGKADRMIGADDKVNAVRELHRYVKRNYPNVIVTKINRIES